MWAGSRGWDGDWRIDSTGVFQSDELEGQAAKQRSREGKPVGFNENRVDAWLYSPAVGPLIKITEAALRELIKIVSNTTSALPLSGQRPICKLNRDFMTRRMQNSTPETSLLGQQRACESDGNSAIEEAEIPSKKPTWVELRHEALIPDEIFDTMAPAAG
jgi:hypothetical protein